MTPSGSNEALYLIIRILGMHIIPLTAVACGCHSAQTLPAGANDGQRESSAYPEFGFQYDGGVLKQ